MPDPDKEKQMRSERTTHRPTLWRLGIGVAVLLFSTYGSVLASNDLVPATEPIGTVTGFSGSVDRAASSGGLRAPTAAISGTTRVATAPGPVAPDTQPSLPVGASDTATGLAWSQPLSAPASTTLMVVGLVAYSPTGFGANTFAASDNGTPMMALTPVARSADDTLRAQLFGIYSTSYSNNLVSSGMGNGASPSAKLACARGFTGVSDATAGHPTTTAFAGTANTMNAQGQISVTDPGATQGQALVSVFGITRNATNQNFSKGASQVLDCGPISFSATTAPNAYIALDHIPVSSNGIVTEVWQTDQPGQKAVLASVALNPQPGPTSSRSLSLVVRRTSRSLLFSWYAKTNRQVLGFNVYAAGKRLNRAVIRTHPAARYSFRSKKSTLSGPYRLVALLANGSSETIGFGR